LDAVRTTAGDGSTTMAEPPHQQYCTKCVYPSFAAAVATFDDEGVCTGCRVNEAKQHIDWADGARSSRRSSRSTGAGTGPTTTA